MFTWFVSGDKGKQRQMAGMRKEFYQFCTDSTKGSITVNARTSKGQGYSQDHPGRIQVESKTKSSGTQVKDEIQRESRLCKDQDQSRSSPFQVFPNVQIMIKAYHKDQQKCISIHRALFLYPLPFD